MRWRCWGFTLLVLPLVANANPHEAEMEVKNKRVLISGAGVAGLTLAYWLKQHGFIPTLVEKHPCLRTGGYKIDIRGTALEVIGRMELYPSLFDARTDIQGATIVDESGAYVTTLSADTCGCRVAGDLEIMRGDLCEILMKRVGDVECLFGDCIKQISQNEEGVYVEFEKNAPGVFDLVVGADGLHSAVRKLTFGEESQFLHDLGFYISVFTIPNYRNLDRWEFEYFDPPKYVNLYSARGDRNAKAGFGFSSKSRQVDLRDKEEQQKLLEDTFGRTGWEEVTRILAFMREAPDFYFDRAAQIHMSRWSNGRIALIGDAGYAPSPLSGQGTSVAIIGAYILAGELAEAHGDYNRAFSAYENALRHFVKRNQDLVDLSVTIMAEKDDSWMTWISYHAMRLLPARCVEVIKTWSTKRVHDAASDLKLKNYSPACELIL